MVIASFFAQNFRIVLIQFYKLFTSKIDEIFIVYTIIVWLLENVFLFFLRLYFETFRHACKTVGALRVASLALSVAQSTV